MKRLFNHMLLPPFGSGLLEEKYKSYSRGPSNYIVICHREVLTKRVVAKKWPVAPLVFASLPAPPHSRRNQRCE